LHWAARMSWSAVWLSRALVTAFATLIVLVPDADASLRTVSDEDLARSSAAAVHGLVVAAESAWDPAADAIYTFVTLDVVQAWGLPGSPSRLVVKQLGGVIGDVALVIGGQARFAAGEEVFVFLDVRPRDASLSVAGLELGKWALDAPIAGDPAMTREVHGHDPGVVVARDTRRLTDLQRLAALAGTRASAAHARFSAAGGLAGDAAGTYGPAFTFLSPTTPARWHQADSGAPVYVDTQTGGHPQFAGGGLTQLVRAAAMWGTAGSLSLPPGVARTARCFTNTESPDGRISVTYGDPCGEISDGSSTLAIGGAYYSNSDVRTVSGISFWKITKGMVVTDNPPTKFATMSTGCYEEMLAHELGHAIGFGHAAARPAIMYPAISGDCFGRSTSLPLQADDLAGMATIYPGAPAAGPPGVPGGLTSAVSGSTVTIAWTAPSGGSAPLGYQLQAGSAPGLANYGATNTGGTSLVVPAVPNGVYYVRVVALNAAGSSAPTADHVVTVGPVAPGAPRALSAVAGPGGTVAITWQPPASGGTPSNYVVLAGYVSGAATFQIPVSGTTLAGAGVPAAAYYVRVVAQNAAGISPASNEVLLVVP
jgi:hypothetical protein